jgi:hypothetical protein
MHITPQPYTTPINEAKFTSKHFHLPRVLLIIFIVLLSGGIFGTLGYFEGIGQQVNSTPVVKNNTHSKHINISPDTKTTKITSGIKQNKQINIPTPIVIQAQVGTNGIIKIPELGIELAVPDSIKDIVYTIDNSASGSLSTGQQVTTVILSTQSLSRLFPDCAVKGSAPALGYLSRVSGQYPKNPDVDLGNVAGGLVKQYHTFYIGYNSPQAVCSYNSDNTVSKVGVTDLNLFTQSLKTIQPIQ